MKSIVLIGYSGHAFVVADIFLSMQREVIAYCDRLEKQANPYNLTYLGSEESSAAISVLQKSDYFICIGDNLIRRKIYTHLSSNLPLPTNAIHASAILSSKIEFDGGGGIMVGARAVVNPLAKIGKGVILNTACIIEHECQISDFCHIAPNAVLCGNVNVGENSFIGAGVVIKQNIKIGKNAVIGAGAVVIDHIPDDTKVVGNPARLI
jgi:sugar O-acyltransferase (sialic acid O-acetyltransferase NeuD family)